MRAVEEEVLSRVPRQEGRFHVGPVGGSAVEDRAHGADGREAVGGGDFLEFYRRGFDLGGVGVFVAALPGAAEGVAVDFVDDVHAAFEGWVGVWVDEGGGVDHS